MKSILHNESLKNEKFTFDNLLYYKLKDTSTKMINLFNQIPTTEVWNEEGINVTIRQIEIYYEMGLIPSHSELKVLFQQLLEVVNHLEKMAELGLMGMNIPVKYGGSEAGAAAPAAPGKTGLRGRPARGSARFRGLKKGAKIASIGIYRPRGNRFCSCARVGGSLVNGRAA